MGGAPMSAGLDPNLSRRLLWMARPEGLEPPTKEVEAPCSIQLSYGRAPDGPSPNGGARAADSVDCAGRECG
jgi:hypothetical protein